MSSRLVGGALLVAVVAAPCAADRRGDKPGIAALEARVADGGVVVSFRVDHAVDEDTLERIRSGIPVEHRHRVELLAKRTMWPSRVVSRIRVETAAVYDALTRRFELSRSVSTGPHGNKKWSAVSEESHTTESVDELVDWLTVFDRLPELSLPDKARDRRLRVRVESTLNRRFLLYLIPARLTVSAERRLEG